MRVGLEFDKALFWAVGRYAGLELAFRVSEHKRINCNLHVRTSRLESPQNVFEGNIEILNPKP